MSFPPFESGWRLGTAAIVADDIVADDDAGGKPVSR